MEANKEGYCKESICKAVTHLITESEPHPQIGWEAYHIAIRGGKNVCFVEEFEELERIFGGVKHDEVASKIRTDDSMGGALILLEMYSASCNES